MVIEFYVQSLKKKPVPWMKKYARLVKFNTYFPPKKTTAGYMHGT